MRVLIVDDDPDARDLARRALEQELSGLEAHQIVEADGLEAALDQGTPDILLTDYDLRWATGLDVFERVKARHPGCVCVMFTGTGNEELAVRAMKLGFDDYLVKGPKQFRRMAASVRIAWERAAERRALTENRDLLLQELYHRLHNNLQMILSLMTLTARNVPDAASREQIQDLGRRIQALSALQEQFYRSPDFRRVEFAGYLDKLTRNLVALYGGRIQLAVTLDRTELPVGVAVPLGLAANELLMNALKHAFPDERAGQLQVELRREAGQVRLVVSDDGVGFRHGLAEAPTGLGLQLVQRLVAQLEGDVRFEDRAMGSACVMSLSL